MQSNTSFPGRNEIIQRVPSISHGENGRKFICLAHENNKSILVWTVNGSLDTLTQLITV
jgi:hypothetical protein